MMCFCFEHNFCFLCPSVCTYSGVYISLSLGSHISGAKSSRATLSSFLRSLNISNENTISCITPTHQQCCLEKPSLFLTWVTGYKYFSSSSAGRPFGSVLSSFPLGNLIWAGTGKILSSSSQHAALLSSISPEHTNTNRYSGLVESTE